MQTSKLWVVAGNGVQPRWEEGTVAPAGAVGNGVAAGDVREGGAFRGRGREGGVAAGEERAHRWAVGALRRLHPLRRCFRPAQRFAH